MRIIATAIASLCLWVGLGHAAEDCEFARTTDQCGKCAIYHEARGLSQEGQMAVAQVVLNRVASPRYPNTVCGVVWQWGWVTWTKNGVKYKKKVGQFSFTTDGRSDRMYDPEAAERAAMIWQALVFMRQLGRDEEITGLSRDVLYYHTPAVRPGWSRKFQRVAQLDGHIFYRRK